MEVRAKTPYALRKLLELLQDTDVLITVRISDEQGDLARKRQRVQELLNDYGVPFNWEEGGEAECPEQGCVG